MCQTWTFIVTMKNVSSTFYKSKLDPSPEFRKNWPLIYWTPVKNQTLCFFWMQNRPSTCAYIVRITTNIFALARRRKDVTNM